MDFPDVLKQRAKLPIERFRVVRQSDELNLFKVRRGIVFIFAEWSGPAYMAFERFTQLLSEMEVRDIDLVVLDIDCLSPEEGQALWGGKSLGGGGETLWIRDGPIVARSLLYLTGSETEIVKNTADLLRD